MSNEFEGWKFYQPYDGQKANDCIATVMGLAETAKIVCFNFNGFGELKVTADMTRDQIWKMMYDRQEEFFAKRQQEKAESIDSMKRHIAILETLSLSDLQVALDWLRKFGQLTPSDLNERHSEQPEGGRKLYDLEEGRLEYILMQFKKAGYMPQWHSLTKPIELEDTWGLKHWGEQKLIIAKKQLVEMILSSEFQTKRLDVLSSLKYWSRHLAKAEHMDNIS